ncbi:MULTISPECIES: DUF397 domain-containing protein [Streptomyces]|uniref:DUF397 domain-containing protein n=2 Tax=Streptomyces TaxID=1883 RepID=A0A0W7XAZ9_9ACTN|nr:MULTISPECIES: DUF397 domain-containing protein [Streptomyces]KUF19762.1 DUF397 domain-containing protein [Streptomyces silvensis]MVO87832.1 DUF397 domain-containing protein [Streptomyces typhae]
MRTVDLSSTTWRRSSYSNSDGGACVEVSHDFLALASWRKSSHSNSSGGECVEISHDFLDAAAWRKSSYSNPDGGQCLELTHDFEGIVPIRDSKNPAGPALILSAPAWSTFLNGVKAGG